MITGAVRQLLVTVGVKSIALLFTPQGFETLTMDTAERKLGFKVVFASGEDPDYPVTELDYHSPQTRGWQSPR